MSTLNKANFQVHLPTGFKGCPFIANMLCGWKGVMINEAIMLEGAATLKLK